MSHVTYVGRYIFFPLTYQSQDISFTKWVTLLTLGLAPLIAHILAGTPRASYLSKRRPKWHEQFVHYNPKSILWRYAAIADRRIRARNWGRADIAAANAIFWTSEGWDRSEAMVDRGLPYCTHIPDHARIAVFSGEMVKTLVVTLQGTQAVFALTSSLASGTYNDGFDRSVAVDFIFSPLAPTDMRFPTIGFTATSFTVLLFYIFFLAATSVICGVYFAAGSSSTVLPCNTAPWYKLYTAAIMTMGLVTLIISCLETHQTPCGKFTTVPGLNGDYYACDTLSQTTVPLGRDDSKFFGISGTRTWGLGENYTLHSGESLVYNVTGTYLFREQ
ncbi:hypothetical protein PG988_004275 [Apiospora saccharicola]